MLPKTTVAIVSHDAGGAEILCNWVVRQSEPYLLVLEGPARKIFERKLGSIETLLLEDAIGQADWVLTGTSWQSDIENQAIKCARDLGKTCVSFLDHWVNFRQRFEVNNKLVLPDEIWVGDEDAFELAQEIFDDVDVRLKSNPYFEDMKSQIEELNSNQPNNIKNKSILYVCSPLREHAKMKFGNELYWGFSEEDAVRYFMKNLHILNHATGSVVLRPHPSEEKNKYQWAVEEFSPLVVIGGNVDLLAEIAASDIIAGYNSMAMVIGMIAGKRIINALPPGKIINTLPMASIEQMSELIENNKGQP